jgi:hypothetical protein
VECFSLSKKLKRIKKPEKLHITIEIMKVVFTVAVRNPDWFWSEEQMEKEKDYREEWEAINEDKIDKHNPSWQYELPFDVKQIEDNRYAEHTLKFTAVANPEEIVHYVLHDVTVVKFIGEEQTIEAVISNSLIHQYIGAKKSVHKNYEYFYLKENASYYHPFDKLIWMAADAKAELEEHLGVNFEL